MSRRFIRRALTLVVALGMLTAYAGLAGCPQKQDPDPEEEKVPGSGTNKETGGGQQSSGS